MSTSQETARAVNATIRDFAADPRIPEDAEWEFFCECGCFTLVSLTLVDYDKQLGVWAAGHRVTGRRLPLDQEAFGPAARKAARRP